MTKYILDEHGEPMPCRGLFTWARFMEDSERRVVSRDVVEGCRISTVFLGLDHSFGEGDPILWETMVFGVPIVDGWMERCGGSREQAEAMHVRMVNKVRETLVNAITERKTI